MAANERQSEAEPVEADSEIAECISGVLDEVEDVGSPGGNVR